MAFDGFSPEVISTTRATLLSGACPETSRPAAVEVDARHAAFTAVGGCPSLRLRDCSRWPERQGCGQQCLTQVEAAPRECLLRTILARWYAGKRCVICHKPIPAFNWLDLDWLEFQPALMDGEGRTLAWDEFPPEQLLEALAKDSRRWWTAQEAREAFERLDRRGQKP